MTDDLETADAEAKELLKKIEAESEAKAAEEAEAAKAAEEEGDELVSYRVWKLTNSLNWYDIPEHFSIGLFRTMRN